MSSASDISLEGENGGEEEIDVEKQKQILNLCAIEKKAKLESEWKNKKTELKLEWKKKKTDLKLEWKKKKSDLKLEYEGKKTNIEHELGREIIELDSKTKKKTI